MSGSSDLRERLAGPVLEVAPLLLNAVLRHGDVGVRLTEVEAYAGPDDPGSHAYRGRTRRNEVMFGPAGRLYCYFTYGMHVCSNVTVGADRTPSAVLIRAGEVIEGADIARARRADAAARDLARGPARLCRALGIELTDNGTDLAAGAVTLELSAPPAEVRTGPRVGLREAADRPWRFWIDGDPTVSVYRRHRLAAPPG